MAGADLSNVIRFPLERIRGLSLDLLREVAPDLREVLLAADSCGLDNPRRDLSDIVDARTAEYILNEAPQQPGAARTQMLDAMASRVIEAAAASCRAVQAAHRAAAAMRQSLEAARRIGQGWEEELEQRSSELTLAWAASLVEAYERCEEAEGVVRATGLARRGEPWTPVDRAGLGEWLAEAGLRRSM